jgi:ribosomal protein S18 acetylase RimI-like enzyme
MSSPSLDPALAALLGRVWPRVPGAVARAAALGFAWTDVSTPFVRREGGRTVGHVGLIELPLVLGGRPIHVGSIHAVCTDPEHRRRGIAHALMAEAMTEADRRFETVILTTVIPEFYTRFGFRVVREHAFTHPLASRPGRPPISGGGRRLEAREADARLLRRLLGGRAPVSLLGGSVEAGVVFVVALLLIWGDLARVHHHEALDLITVHEIRGGELALHDVVGAEIPPLETIVRAIGGDVSRVRAYFAPDRLGGEWTAEPWDQERAAEHGDVWYDALMVRGPWPIDGAFMLPPLSRT